VSLRGWIGTPVIVLPFQLLAVPSSSVPLEAQQLATTQATVAAPAAAVHASSYDSVFDSLLQALPVAEQVATVTNLTIQRDAARFSLQSGKLYLLTPVGGRTVAAAFRGKGVFSFTPPTAIERGRLNRFEKVDSLEASFTELVLVFADTTAGELRAAATFAPAPATGEVTGLVKQSLEFLADENTREFEPDLMSAFLNGDRSAVFYAHVKRSSGGPLMFMVNPNELEGARLHGKVTRRGYQRRSEVISQFPLRGIRPDAAVRRERLRQADIESYRIDVALPPTGIGEIGFSAAATVRIVADTTVGPWVVFELFEKLKVDSARWEGGDRATVVRGKESALLWVLLDGQLRPGDVRTLQLYYHGDLIDRFGDFFLIKSSAAWYPRSLEGRSLAKFDLTFTTGSKYLLASVGERVDSSTSGRSTRSRWVTPNRIRNASFNLGLFEGYEVAEQGALPVTVMVSEEAHKKLARQYAQQRNMRERVGADVSGSLKFFQSVYGPPPVPRFYATEIPGWHGEAFPGMVHLSWATFQDTRDSGEDEVFRAHEVAHQWWGIGVDFASYHDQWLSEGFSNFSGLWYLQSVSKNNDRYFEILKQWRSSILLREGEPGPISLGYRVFASRDDDLDDYQTVVYKKGAWVVHMLRILMLDLKTMGDDRFKAMMKDFYGRYEGRRASTEDFQRVVEKHAGAEMGWFFDQWVHATATPTYRVAHRTEPAENGQFRVKLRVRQEGVPDSFQMFVPVTLDLGKDRKARVRVKVKGPVSEIDLPLMPAEPKKVIFNDLEGVLAEVKTEGWN
jgi:hypothetical protein